MEETKKQEAGQDLSNEQAAEVGGGATCGATASVGTSGGNVTSTAEGPKALLPAGPVCDRGRTAASEGEP